MEVDRRATYHSCQFPKPKYCHVRVILLYSLCVFTLSLLRYRYTRSRPSRVRLKRHTVSKSMKTPSWGLISGLLLFPGDAVAQGVVTKTISIDTGSCAPTATTGGPASNGGAGKGAGLSALASGIGGGTGTGMAAQTGIQTGGNGTSASGIPSGTGGNGTGSGATGNLP